MDEREGSSTDWRIFLQPDTRLCFANSIMEAVRMQWRMPVSGEVLGEIKRMARELEEGIYSSATSQSDYLRGISLKLHTIATRSQNYAQGEGAVMDGASVDWRTQLSPDAQQRIANKIMETLRRHLPITVPERIEELRKIAVHCEEKIYTVSTSQSVYLRGISLKLHTIATGNQNYAQDLQGQHSHSTETKAPMDTTITDWQEECYQMIQPMKEMYFAELNDFQQMIAIKIQQHEALMPPRNSTELEKLKNFKAMLERTLAFLQVSKANIPAAMKEKLPIYEKQIMRIVASKKLFHSQRDSVVKVSSVQPT